MKKILTMPISPSLAGIKRGSVEEALRRLRPSELKAGYRKKRWIFIRIGQGFWGRARLR